MASSFSCHRISVKVDQDLWQMVKNLPKDLVSNHLKLLAFVIDQSSLGLFTLNFGYLPL